MEYQTVMAKSNTKTNRGDQAHDPSHYRRKLLGRLSSIQFPSRRTDVRLDRSAFRSRSRDHDDRRRCKERRGCSCNRLERERSSSWEHSLANEHPAQ
jgi:hypothetical protein